MKYNYKIIAILVSLFFIAEVLGLAFVYQDIRVVETTKIVDGVEKVVKEIHHPETVVGPRPEFFPYETLLMVLISVGIGTGLILLLIRFRKLGLWRVFFFVASFLAMFVGLGVILNSWIALILALLLAILKIKFANIITHNVTEFLMYAGIAILFVPLFDISWVIVLLIIISIYDFIAVFKSKHMVTMAKSLGKTKLFAGLVVPYKSIRSGSVSAASQKVKGKISEKLEGAGAILGGGDIAFPLIFAGVVMEWLINVGQLAKSLAFMKVLIIPIVLTAILFLLLTKGQKGKFYPAMPFMTAGCLLGFAVVLLV